MPRYKEKGEDPGSNARYFHEGGLGWYTYIWCGGCQHTEQPCNMIEARQNGWRSKPGWGYLCKECLTRLGLDKKRPSSAAPIDKNTAL